LALSLQGDQGRGKKAIAEAFAKKDERTGWWGDYGSSLRDQALMVMLAKQHKLSVPKSDARLLDLSKRLAGDGDGYHWYSTQEQIAIARLGKQMIGSLDPNNTLSGEVTVRGNASTLLADRIHSRSFDYRDLDGGVRYALRSSGKLYATLDVAGIPRARPAPKTDTLSVVRRYFNLDGTPWKGGNLKEGQSLIVQLEIEGRTRMPDALLVDLLPAGLEIENLNLTPAEQWADVSIDGTSLDERGSQANILHEEYRDDRYVAALKLEYGTAKLYYIARAVTPGTYVVPPPQVEDMYRPELRAVGKAWPEAITVVQP
jgi:uncharacterized protein YfaS (alpha-2-macroglobulin family)